MVHIYLLLPDVLATQIKLLCKHHITQLFQLQIVPVKHKLLLHLLKRTYFSVESKFYLPKFIVFLYNHFRNSACCLFLFWCISL